MIILFKLKAKHAFITMFQVLLYYSLCWTKRDKNKL